MLDNTILFFKSENEGVKEERERESWRKERGREGEIREEKGRTEGG